MYLTVTPKFCAAAIPITSCFAAIQTLSLDGSSGFGSSGFGSGVVGFEPFPPLPTFPLTKEIVLLGNEPPSFASIGTLIT
ncbi:hypothetical protein D3C72_1741130 [compost metagenome]